MNTEYLSYVIKRVNFWRKTSMYAKELLVHDGGQRQAVEGFHASIINTLGVLDLAYIDKISEVYVFFGIILKYLFL